MLSFARAKIQPPPRARAGAMLARPHLQSRLAHAMQSRTLVLLHAAAGFGKTTALTQAIDALPQGTAVAWVGCNDGDTPLQLFSCPVAALDPFDLPWRTAPDALIASALAGGDNPVRQQKALRNMAAELINALDAAEVPHGVIAVDDLHRVDDPAIFRFLDLLFERFTPLPWRWPPGKRRRSRGRSPFRAHGRLACRPEARRQRADRRSQRRPVADRLAPGNGDVMSSRCADADTFVAMLRSGRSPEGRALQVMPFEALKQLSDTDARALHLYLGSLRKP